LLEIDVPTHEEDTKQQERDNKNKRIQAGDYFASEEIFYGFHSLKVFICFFFDT